MMLGGLKLQNIMIPFHYDGNMMDYNGYSNEAKVWWDINDNVLARVDYKTWYKETPIDKFDREQNERILKQQKMIEDGIYIQVPAVTWNSNYEFYDTLIIDNTKRGRSAAQFILKSKTSNKTYNMFMKGCLDLMQKTTITKGAITGWFSFIKRGANYGIEFIRE